MYGHEGVHVRVCPWLVYELTVSIVIECQGTDCVIRVWTLTLPTKT